MESKPTDVILPPLVNDRIVGPTGSWPSADGIFDVAGNVLQSVATSATELAETVICLPDLSSENPFE